MNLQVAEDLGLVQHVKSFFTDSDRHHYPKPAHSEQSTSNPTTISERAHFHSSPLLAAYSGMHPSRNANQGYEEEEDEYDDENDNEGDGEHESEGEMGQTIHQTSMHDPLHLHGPVTQDISMVHGEAEPSELMLLEMSEDIRIGSPDDGSNNLDSDMHMLGLNQSVHHPGHESTHHHWPLLPDQLCDDLQLPVPGKDLLGCIL